MSVLDVFNNNAFSMLSITDRVNRQPFVPGRVGRLGIFEEKGVYTTFIAVEEHNGLLSLIPSTPRGGPGSENAHIKNKIRNLSIPHLELTDTVMADEVQNVRQFGTDDQLATVQAVMDMRIAEMLPKHDATVEFGRIGAVRGIILDADGSTVIYNLFTEFGQTQQTLDFTLGTTTTDMIGNLTIVAGLIEDSLGAAVYDHIHAFVGKTWWAKFISHPKVATAYQYYQATGQNMNPLREDLRYAGFTFGNITIEQYRGKVSGVAFMPDSEAQFFPVGVPGLYKTYFAPADFIDTVNTLGLPRYAMQDALPFDPQKGRRIRTQSNPLSICTRPEVLIKGTTSN
jgi:hypothetical protein